MFLSSQAQVAEHRSAAEAAEEIGDELGEEEGAEEGGGRRRGRRRGGGHADTKSRGPHLAGGKEPTTGRDEATDATDTVGKLTEPKKLLEVAMAAVCVDQHMSLFVTSPVVL